MTYQFQEVITMILTNMIRLNVLPHVGRFVDLITTKTYQGTMTIVTPHNTAAVARMTKDLPPRVVWMR